MRKLLNRKIVEQIGDAPSVMKNSQTMTMWFPTTGIRKEWAELGEMITRKTFSNAFLVQ